ncbi:Ig-like domain-containing protein, partial [Spirochaetota bacterium]
MSVVFPTNLDSDTISKVNFYLTNEIGETNKGNLSYSGDLIRMEPSGDLQPDTTYTVIVTSNIKAVDGTSLVNNHIFTFSTIPPLSTIGEMVPTNDSITAQVNKPVSYVFPDVNQLTLNNSTFYLLDETSTPVAASRSYDPMYYTIVLTPLGVLSAEHTYTVHITTNVK